MEVSRLIELHCCNILMLMGLACADIGEELGDGIREKMRCESFQVANRWRRRRKGVLDQSTKIIYFVRGHTGGGLTLCCREV